MITGSLMLLISALRNNAIDFQHLFHNCGLGLKGQSNKRLIPMSEVKQHQMEGSMWTVLKGRVYNISPYMKFHPGGMGIMQKFSMFKFSFSEFIIHSILL